MPTEATTIRTPEKHAERFRSMGLEVVPPIASFRVGDYGGKGLWTPEKLDAVSASYDLDQFRAPVTLDHLQEGPAYGYVGAAWREGDTLWTECWISPELRQLVTNGYYRSRSIELYAQPPGLRALTFLGAATPHVKGMPDVEFSGDAAFEKFDYCGDSPFGPKPEGLEMGPAEAQTSCGMVLGHFHEFSYDADGNGFSGPPLYWDRDGRCCIAAGAVGFHTHTLIDGTVQPTEFQGTSHTHPFFAYFSEGDHTKEEAPMPPTTQSAPTEVAAPVKSFAEMFPEQAAEMEALRKRTADAEENAAITQDHAAFATAFSAAAAAGRVTPAERPVLLRTFCALRAASRRLRGSGAEPAKFAFSENIGETAANPSFAEAADQFLASFASRPAILTPAPMASDAQPSSAPSSGNIIEDRREALKAHGFSHEEATGIVYKELDSGKLVQGKPMPPLPPKPAAAASAK